MLQRRVQLVAGFYEMGPSILLDSADYTNAEEVTGSTLRQFHRPCFLRGVVDERQFTVRTTVISGTY
ncbi:hypothetical protein Mp_2g18910 [Marchantia polymorpha subsp. ruderalis]|uniref:Uncharacterized protein n=1 Tax=Marchantia polymorpha TaxID=3197 RepID=A0A2R6W8P0_MARPO|nr:hypothetical protein MARPO_0128s0006 [Marchantia polymorpha]BBN02879.1 hypothetical protein Mp_2g18910 [Marchantia polymorpha subsp. ruderalis]|eukprot:PTQ30182.1 hypothetical protein MARPO_0128s0006 [Marchantia polymorpha]